MAFFSSRCAGALVLLFGLAFSGAPSALASQEPPTADLRIQEARGGLWSATQVRGTAPLVVTFSGAASTSKTGRVKMYCWSVDGDPTTKTETPTLTRTFATGGLYEVTLVVMDNWGNESTPTAAVRVMVEPSTLHVTARHVPSSSNTIDRVHFRVVGTPEDDALGQSYAWEFGDGSVVVETRKPEVDHDYTASRGPTPVKVTTRWHAADGDLAMDLTTTVDVKGPVVTRLKGYVVSAPAVPGAPPVLDFPLGTPIGFTAKGSSSPYGKIVRVEFDVAGDDAFEVDAGSVFQTTHTFRSIAHPFARARVTDEHGNQGVALINFRLTGLLPVLNVHPASGPVGSTVEVQAHESRDLTTMVTPVGLKLETSLPVESLGDGRWRVTLDSAGEHTLKLIVNDAQGKTAATTATVTGGGKPRALLRVTPQEGACSVDQPLAVRLHADESRSDGGDIVKYEWDLDGNGTFEQESDHSGPVVHTIETAGTHVLRVRVTDALGQTDVDTVWITTREAQPVTGASLDLLHTCAGWAASLKGDHTFSDGSVDSRWLGSDNTFRRPGRVDPVFRVVWSGTSFTISGRTEGKGWLKVIRAEGEVSEDASRLLRLKVKVVSKQVGRGHLGGYRFEAELVDLPLMQVRPVRPGSGQTQVMYGIEGPTGARHVKSFAYVSLASEGNVTHRNTGWDENTFVVVSFLQVTIQ